MKKNHKIYLFLMSLIISFMLSGCSMNDVRVKLGLKNNDFEYIKQGKIEKIIIQNTRDAGFRFVVTDPRAIAELYDILSTAKHAETRSSLKPDYIFEMQESTDKVYRFNYIAGLDKEEGGNLYSDDKTYIVSKRIDSDIIKSLWNIRIPKDFKYIYYHSLLEVMEDYRNSGDQTNQIGLNLEDDVEVAKFILSTDLEDFNAELQDKVKNIKLIEKDRENYNIVASVKTTGYRSTLYKGIITFLNKKDNTEKKYYIIDEYKDGNWNISITPDKKPEKF